MTQTLPVLASSVPSGRQLLRSGHPPTSSARPRPVCQPPFFSTSSPSHHLHCLSSEVLGEGRFCIKCRLGDSLVGWTQRGAPEVRRGPDLASTLNCIQLVRL